MSAFAIDELAAFIVRAKAATYAGDGPRSAPCRPGSHDLWYREGDFAYLDSYFGGADFLGQEVVYHADQPVWAMNYYGRLLEPALIAPDEVGAVLKESLSALYRQGRFLGGFQFAARKGDYVDTNVGDTGFFTGREWIARQGRKVYELIYHGGLIA